MYSEENKHNLSNDDNSLVIFKALSNFVKSLSDFFGKKQHSLKLYCHLINKTTLCDEKPILKHIEIFKNFCIQNRDSIYSKDSSKLIVTQISYSSKVFIDFPQIFKLIDNDTKNIIWKHLLIISALVDPESKAKDILKNSKEEEKCGNEEDFLSNLVSKIETHVKPDSNPMQAISSLISSGTFTDLVGGMNDGLSNGSLDLGKLISSVQTTIGKFSDISNQNPKNDNKQPNIDMSSMMNMLGPMLASLGDNKNKIEEIE
jgi:hypothetical protein